MKRIKKINKVAKKKLDKKCHFCSCNIYDLLDVHRIIEGANDGEYVEHNTVTCCANCHRKIHSGLIKIDRKYYSTKGWILHYWIEGEEKWD